MIIVLFLVLTLNQTLTFGVEVPLDGLFDHVAARRFWCTAFGRCVAEVSWAQMVEALESEDIPPSPLLLCEIRSVLDEAQDCIRADIILTLVIVR